MKFELFCVCLVLLTVDWSWASSTCMYNQSATVHDKGTKVAESKAHIGILYA